MSTRKKIKYVHEGKYAAEVEVELIEDETGWSPYLSKKDAYLLDDVRSALERRRRRRGKAREGVYSDSSGGLTTYA